MIISLEFLSTFSPDFPVKDSREFPRIFFKIVTWESNPCYIFRIPIKKLILFYYQWFEDFKLKRQVFEYLNNFNLLNGDGNSMPIKNTHYFLAEFKKFIWLSIVYNFINHFSSLSYCREVQNKKLLKYNGLICWRCIKVTWLIIAPFVKASSF